MGSTAAVFALFLLVLQWPRGLGRTLSGRQLLNTGGKYNYQAAGSDWSEAFPECSGDRQSPINIDTEVVKTYPRDLTARIITFGRGDHVRVQNNGHSVVVLWDQADPPSILLPIVDGKPYGSIDPLDQDHDNNVDNASEVATQRFSFANVELLQFHFHISSENALDGVLYPMEAHIVAKVPKDEVLECGDDACIVVFAVLYKLAEEDNDFLEPFLEAAPEALGEEHEEAFPSYFAFNLDDMVPDEKSYYTWIGSFTTPPCTEGVMWILFDTVGTLSTRQLTLLQSRMGGARNECQRQMIEDGEEDMEEFMEECNFIGDLKNNRELQPLNGREVSHVGPLAASR